VTREAPSAAQPSSPTPEVMTKERARRITMAGRALATIALVGLFLGAVTARVIWAGEAEIASSTAALRRGDAADAAVHARRAAGFYAPGAPHVRVAYERLIVIATAAEGLGDRDLALLAWRGVRTAALETRSVYVPHEADLDRANKAIARIEAAAPRPPGTRTDSPQRIEQNLLASLLRDESPRLPWVLALLVAFGLWVGGAVVAVRRATTQAPDEPAGGFVVGRAKVPLLVTFAGILLWVLAFWQA